MQTQANLSSYVTFNPLAMHRDTLLAEAMRTLAETGIHHWPVVNDERELVGSLSEGDIVQALEGRTPLRTGEVRRAREENVGTAVVQALTVSAAMSDVVTYATLAESPRQVLKKLIDFQVHWLPVLEDGIVIGVSTVSDFLREFSYGQFELARMQVLDVMEPVEVIGGDASLEDAWDVLREQPSDCLGVVRGDFPLGVLSQRDLRLGKCRVAISQWLESQCVESEFECVGPRTVLEVVSAAPTIRPGERLQSAATLMLDHNRQAIAVVNQASRMMGAVTELGIFRRMLNFLV